MGNSVHLSLRHFTFTHYVHLFHAEPCEKKKEKILVGSRAPHLLVEYILIGCKSGMGFLGVLVFLHCAVNTSNTNNS